MPDDEAFWESIIASHQRTSAPWDGDRWRGLRDPSRGRLLDAAIVVVRAARELTTIAEAVLVEQRERVHRPGRPASAPERLDGSMQRGEQIDLTY